MFVKLFEQDIECFEKGQINEDGLSRAKMNVLNEYVRSCRDLKVKTLVLNSVIWEDNYFETFDYIKEAGLKEVIITNTSSELMDILFYLGMIGITNFKAILVEKQKTWEGLDFPQKGLLIKL